jgi:hypothetical protein
MIDLPMSTTVNRFVPKEKFYSKTSMNAKLRQQFTDEIKTITWTNKISPDTLNISAGDYTELQVFELILKSADASVSVLKQIDTYIPYPILFIISKSGASKAVMSYKEGAIRNQNNMKEDSYFDTGWRKDLSLELKGRSVDEIYKNYLYQIAPHLNDSNQFNVKKAVEHSKTKQTIQSQIDALNKQIRNELSGAKKQELARQRYKLEQQSIEP